MLMFCVLRNDSFHGAAELLVSFFFMQVTENKKKNYFIQKNVNKKVSFFSSEEEGFLAEECPIHLLS